MSVKTYDPADILITFGPSIISGFSASAIVTVTRNAGTYTQKTGADGEAVRNRSHDKSGQIKITLMQTSGSNDILSAYAQLDELDNIGKFPVLVKDKAGRSLYAAAEAWVSKPADAAFANEAGDREWTIETSSLEWFTGGN